MCRTEEREWEAMEELLPIVLFKTFAPGEEDPTYVETSASMASMLLWATAVRELAFPTTLLTRRMAPPAEPWTLRERAIPLAIRPTAIDGAWVSARDTGWLLSETSRAINDLLARPAANVLVLDGLDELRTLTAWSDAVNLAADAPVGHTLRGSAQRLQSHARRTTTTLVDALLVRPTPVADVADDVLRLSRAVAGLLVVSRVQVRDRRFERFLSTVRGRVATLIADGEEPPPDEQPERHAALPDARWVRLEGGFHQVPEPVLAPVLADFYRG